MGGAAGRALGGGRPVQSIVNFGGYKIVSNVFQ